MFKQSHVLVIPAAGSSQRFSDVGFAIPKWKLDVNGISMLRKSIESLSLIPEKTKVVIMTLRVHAREIEEIIPNDKDCELIYLDTKTRGQADTVYQFTKTCTNDHSLSIWNCDSWLNPKILSKINFDENFIITNKMQGDRWSFVKTDKIGAVINVQEKTRISEKTSIGFYNFSKLTDFNEAFINFPQDGELYVAPLFNYLINKNHFVKNISIKNQDYISFGTPEEYHNAIGK